MRNKLHTHGGKRTPSPGKKVGRPRDGAKVKAKIAITLDPDLLKRLDAQIRAQGLESRSAAIALALKSWLKVDLDQVLAALDQFDQELANDDNA